MTQSDEFRILGRRPGNEESIRFEYRGVVFDQDSFHVVAGLNAVDTREYVEQTFAALEQARLDTDCRGYLVHLEQVGILSPTQRELVIDRLMALEGDEIDIDKLKWVVLMVLFSQPGQETAFSRMEDLVFEDRSGAIH